MRLMPSLRRFVLRRCDGGIAYLALLIVIAIIGITAAASVQIGSIMQRRAAEEELLAIGAEFRRALISYASSTPVGQSSAPPNLESLLKDPRYPNVRRHLRKLYFDPLTGTQKWGVVMSLDGKGIVGIHSLSTGQPIKIGNFEPLFQSFADKSSYTEWVFMAVQPTVPVPGGVTMPGGASTSGTSSTTSPTTSQPATNSPAKW